MRWPARLLKDISPELADIRRQLAGVDERERGFSRPVEVQLAGTIYRAVLRYEAVVIAGESAESKDAAFNDLIRTLQARGYRQLKSQVSFHGSRYLGSQEPWVEYRDADQVVEHPRGLSGWLGHVSKLLGLGTSSARRG